ncbi:MAG TPA: efflux RND transporter periplasmic adaptor subunit [Verrucomicrobiae bacterium]
MTLAQAQLRPMTRTVTVTGTLAAQEKSILSAKVSGRLQELQVDIGSVVHQGDLLAQIEPRDYELGLQQAAAALAQARTALGLVPDGEDDAVELEAVSAVRQAKAVLEEATSNQDRVKNLSRSGIASGSEMDTVAAAYKVASSRYQTALEDARARTATVAQRRAEYELARKRLADASIRAPFDGAVQSRPAHPGEYVAPGTAIMELVKTDPLRLRLQVPERECALVRTGQAVQLFVEADTNAYPGRIARLSPALDEGNRMLLVEADVPARGPLRAGLFARAHIILNDREEGLSIPANALSTFAGIEKVVLVESAKAVERVVVTGRRGPDWIEIISGIGAGDQVILNPAGLRTGQPVTVTGIKPAGSPGDTDKLARGHAAS